MDVCTRTLGTAAWLKTPKPAPGASTDRRTVSSARHTHGSSSAIRRPRRRLASPEPGSCYVTRPPPRFSGGGPHSRRAGPARSAGVFWLRSPALRPLMSRAPSRRRVLCRTAGTDARCDRASSDRVHHVGRHAVIGESRRSGWALHRWPQAGGEGKRGIRDMSHD